MASRRVKKSKSGEKKNTLSQKQKHQQSKAENYVETLESNGAPFVKIIEQPASRMVRFRYQCEGRSAAAVPGMSSTPRNKTYPEIEIVGYKGASVVVVSCVSKDAPYRPHPYNLIGREGCRRGVYTVANKTGTTRIKFCSLGVQCVKRTGVQASLKIRENIRVDPFKTGFEHATEAIFVDMTAVRLCFQVFIEDSSGRFTIPLKPVVSEPIYDSRAVADLKIYQMCSSSTALGDKPIILLCDKIIREKTMVRFYEEKGSDVIWQSYGDYRPSDIHRQTAIKLYPPQYHNLDITEPVQVYVQLVNVDGFASEPCPFKYMPIDSDEVLLKRKCKRIGLEIGTDSKKEHASRGDSFRNIVESWLKPNITRSLSTHSKEDVYTETSSSDETLESAYSSIPEVISDVISVRMATSEDSNDSVANQKLQTPAHQLPTNSIPNHQQQQASPSKSDYQHEYFQTKSSSMQQPQSASSPLSLGPKLSFIETPKPESLHLQQHHLKQTPPLHHENTPPRSHNLQHQHLSMKSAHKLPLQINSAQLQSSDHLPIESHGHELRQKQNLSISSPHQTEQSPQPLTVRFDSPQLQLSGHSTKESQAFKRSNNNLSMRSPHQPSPNEIQDLLEQLPLRFDSPQLQSPTGSQQQNLAEPSPQQPFRENPELRKQNQAMVLSQMQQHLPKQSPQHGNFATESHKLQQQHLSMKSSYSLPPRMDLAQLQQEYLSIESDEHELKQKQNMSMSSPHSLEQSPQPLPLRLDSPQLQLSEHPAMESHEPKQQRNIPIRSPHQEAPNEIQIQELLEQLPLRFDSPQLQLSEQTPMESHGLKQQQNSSMASPLQPSRKTDELKQQSYLIPSSQQLQKQQPIQWPQQLEKHSPLHSNSPIKSHDFEQQQLSIQSHLQRDSPQLQQQYNQRQTQHYPQQYYPKPIAHPMESIESKQQSQTTQSSQQQQSLHMNTFQVKQNVSGQAQQQNLPMNSPQQQQQNVLLPNSNLQPLGVKPQQQSLHLQQMQSLMLMSTQLQQLQQQQPHSNQQLLQPNHNTIAPLQDGMVATVLANAFASLLENYQSKFQQLIAATANTMLQSGQWNIPPTNNAVNMLAQMQTQQQQQQLMVQQRQQSPAHQQLQEISQNIEQQQAQQSPAHLQHLEQQPHQELARAKIQQRPSNNTHFEKPTNREQSNDHALHNLLNLEENAGSNSIPSSPLWSFDT